MSEDVAMIAASRREDPDTYRGQHTPNPRAEHTRHTSRSGIALTIRGSGEPLVLLHGIGGSSRSCAALADIVARGGWQTICWDAPGYGDSDDPSPEVDHVGAVLEVLDELGIDSAHLFGTSWGGAIAAKVALAKRDRVRSLCLADSSRGSGIDGDKARSMLDRVGDLEAVGAAEFASRRAPRLVAPRCDRRILAAVTADMERVRIPGYAAAAEFMATTDLGPVLHEIDIATLVLVGEHDVVTGVAESRRLAETIPGAHFAVIADAGHAAVQEHPTALAEHLLPHLRSEL